MAALVGLGSCARSPSPPSEPAPDPAGARGVELRYADEADLTQTTRFSVEQAGGGDFGRASFELQARVGWHARGDRREVAFEVVGVDDVDLHGALTLEPDDAPGDDFLAHGKGAYLIDHAGELDDGETARLRANEGFHAALQRMRAGPGSAPTRARLLSLVPVALALPELPREPLVLGERTVLEEVQEIELDGGLLMPAAVTRAYTLIKVDDGGAAPIAELLVDVASSGRVEMSDASLSFEGSAHGMILFDLARGLPVSLELSRTEAFELGGKTGESITVIESVWDG